MKFLSKRKPSSISVAQVMREHFGRPLHELKTASRCFPTTARLDVVNALQELISRELAGVTATGFHCEYRMGATNSISALVSGQHSPAIMAPLEYEEVDVGETYPVRCVKACLWMGSVGSKPVCVLLTPRERHAEATGWHVEVAELPNGGTPEIGGEFLAALERKVSQGASYRGKVISLEQSDNYSGKASGVRVHKLRSVTREAVILPEKTLRLLESNVTDFIKQRSKLKDMGMSLKKGLLFHGPPGTGKTHTIHYLASQLPDHTTLLITAEQVGLLDEYVQLARFLQPAVLVLEDVDLIARARTSMRNPCEESLLNKLLNEMDGLREDAELLFVLTTNRPQDLEAALASRPGRVDQAIEFPLPDDAGRRKLVSLYKGGLDLSDKLVELIVRKTKNSSGAFIKELMRRAAQFLARSNGRQTLESEHVEEALDEMLFAGGTLNVRMLGGAATQDE